MINALMESVYVSQKTHFNTFLPDFSQRAYAIFGIDTALLTPT